MPHFERVTIEYAANGNGLADRGPVGFFERSRRIDCGTCRTARHGNDQGHDRDPIHLHHASAGCLADQTQGGMTSNSSFCASTAGAPKQRSGSIRGGAAAGVASFDRAGEGGNNKAEGIQKPASGSITAPAGGRRRSSPAPSRGRIIGELCWGSAGAALRVSGLLLDGQPGAKPSLDSPVELIDLGESDRVHQRKGIG